MTTPSYPALQRGTSFQLYQGNGAGTEVFSLVCVATTQDFDQKVETDDAMVIDCANPLNLPVRQSVAKGKTFDVSFSGKADFVKFHAIEANQDGAAHNYQVAFSGTGANGGGIYQGAAILADLKVAKSDNGMVSFTASLKGQGLWTYTANA